MTAPSSALRSTPLHDLHVALGGRMVPFAGYRMPVQYPSGILAEHAHTRTAASLFDVSHMGQAWLAARPGVDVGAALESLVPGDLLGLPPGTMRYTLLLDDRGGILDDLMVMRPPAGVPDHRLFLVVNAACKQDDFTHIATALRDRADLAPAEDRALLALQGPRAAEVMARLCPAAAGLAFLSALEAPLLGRPCLISRSGYTGEDGFEVSVPAEAAADLARALLAYDEVAPAGLGARDSLRLEAGLCLYGHDIDTTTTPVEASLAWTVGARRRREGGFPGYDVIMRQIADGPPRRRVGLALQGRQPVREGAAIADADERRIGTVTSGGFSPSLGHPVAMGYVDAGLTASGTPVTVEVRGRTLPATVTKLPFVPPNYHRG